jgi:predicted Zn-dependent protease
VLGALLAVAPPLVARELAGESPGAARLALALGDDSGWTLEVLGRHAADEGRREEGLGWYLAAEALLPGEPFLAAAKALVLVNLGRCQEAVEALGPPGGEARLRPDARRARELAWLALERCREGAGSDAPAR